MKHTGYRRPTIQERALIKGSTRGNVIDLARTAMYFEGLRFMRDPTRAGLAGVCYEIANHAGVTVRLEETKVPVRGSVKMVCGRAYQQSMIFSGITTI